MKSEYDFSKAKRRTNRAVKDAGKLPISLRVDGNDLAELKREAERLGLPYQTLISSILHRFISGDLIDKKEAKKIAG